MDWPPPLFYSADSKWLNKIGQSSEAVSKSKKQIQLQGTSTTKCFCFNGLHGLTAPTFSPTLVATVEETVDDVTAPTNSARPGPRFQAMLTPKPGPGQDAQKLPKQLNPAHSTQRDDPWVKKEVCLVLGTGDSCSRVCCVLPAREHGKPEERRPILMQREGDRRVRPRASASGKERG